MKSILNRKIDLGFIAGAELLSATAIFFVCGVAAAQHRIDGSINTAKCAELVNVRAADLTILSAEFLPPGRFAPPEASSSLQIPELCRVIAVATPTSDSIIRFEVWIPPSEKWNQKLLGVGNGGYSGVLSYESMLNAVRRGFAAAGTDTGHSGDSLSFGALHPERIVDWGHRSVHIMTEFSKLIIRDYSGRFPDKSYFEGCSTGGQEALSEVQRYPEDYDGVIAGDPGNDRVHLNVGFLWSYIASHDANGGVVLRSSKLPLIHKAAVAACDALDGVRDGIISEPQKCHFDPESLLCRGGESDECLTAEQVTAARKIYAGPRNPRTGDQIIAGYSPGSEDADDENASGGWKGYITERSEPMRLDFWRLWVFNDPKWDWHTFDFDHDVAYADTKMAAVNASSSDLKAFNRRGGKIIMYSGWADPIGPPMDTVNYYERVEKEFGRKSTTSFIRLFMVPGMGHCQGGAAPNHFGGAGDISSSSNLIDPKSDALSALVEWVENGIAPERIVASHLMSGVPDSSRALCPYPQVARWTGRGSIDDADSFICKEPGSASPIEAPKR